MKTIKFFLISFGLTLILLNCSPNYSSIRYTIDEPNPVKVNLIRDKSVSFQNAYELTQSFTETFNKKFLKNKLIYAEKVDDIKLLANFKVSIFKRETSYPLGNNKGTKKIEYFLGAKVTFQDPEDKFDYGFAEDLGEIFLTKEEREYDNNNAFNALGDLIEIFLPNNYAINQSHYDELNNLIITKTELLAQKILNSTPNKPPLFSTNNESNMMSKALQ